LSKKRQLVILSTHTSLINTIDIYWHKRKDI